MSEITRSGFPTMTPQERELLGSFIEKEFGIQMPPVKRSLLQSRLARRVQEQGLQDYRQYFQFVRSEAGKDEFLLFTDLVSTHETSFFREDRHFRVLEEELLPKWVQGPPAPLRILVAACSSGEEAYTIAMVVHNFLDHHGPKNWEFAIEGLDLSDQMVNQARRAVYTDERLHKVPPALQRRYLMRSKNPKMKIHRVVPELRRHLDFHQGNLMGELNLKRQSYDLVFCRNVLIYFSRPNQLQVVRRLLDLVVPSGYLFLGHSETMVGSLLGLKAIHHGVFRRSA